MRKNLVSYILIVVATILGIIACFFLFGAGLKASVDEVSDLYSISYKVAFFGDDNYIGNFIPFIAYLLIGVLSLVNVINSFIGSKARKIVGIVLSVLILGLSIFLLFQAQLFVASNANNTFFITQRAGTTWSISGQSIAAAVLGIVGGLASGFGFFRLAD